MSVIFILNWPPGAYEQLQDTFHIQCALFWGFVLSFFFVSKIEIRQLNIEKEKEEEKAEQNKRKNSICKIILIVTSNIRV